MSEVVIIAEGPVGSGKSALLGEIEIALRAIGISVRWDNDKDAMSERHLTKADWQAELELTKPTACLVERLGSDRSQARKAIAEALADWWETHVETPPDVELVDEIMGALTLAKILTAGVYTNDR